MPLILIQLVSSKNKIYLAYFEIFQKLVLLALGNPKIRMRKLGDPSVPVVLAKGSSELTAALILSLTCVHTTIKSINCRDT